MREPLADLLSGPAPGGHLATAAAARALFTRIEELDAALGSDFDRRPLPWAAAFLAGKAFLTYRRRGGSKRSPLPDFYIGAHAALEGLTLLTRDASRYRRYYPRLTILGP